jgi:plastocyanin
MGMSSRSRIAASLFALVLVSSAASVMLPAAPAGATIKTINAVVSGIYKDGHFQPAISSAKHGVTVHWHAMSGHHALKAYGGNWTFSKKIPLGATVSRVFPKKGVFRFYCTIHGSLDKNGVCHGMCGKITIT